MYIFSSSVFFVFLFVMKKKVGEGKRAGGILESHIFLAFKFHGKADHFKQHKNDCLERGYFSTKCFSPILISNDGLQQCFPNFWGQWTAVDAQISPRPPHSIIFKLINKKSIKVYRSLREIYEPGANHN